jgi:hypothetical protein
MIRFTCPNCQTLCLHTVPGEKVYCPKCRQKVLVPAPPQNKTVLGEWQPTTSALAAPALISSTDPPWWQDQLEQGKQPPAPATTGTPMPPPGPVPLVVEAVPVLPASTPAPSHLVPICQTPQASLPETFPVRVVKPPPRRTVRRVPPWVWVGVGVGCFVLPMLAALGAFLTKSTVGNHAAPLPNARCPICGECFHARYHRGVMAQSMQSFTCPNCGIKESELIFNPEWQQSPENPTNAILNSQGKSPFKELPEGPVERP